MKSISITVLSVLFLGLTSFNTSSSLSLLVNFDENIPQSLHDNYVEKLSNKGVHVLGSNNLLQYVEDYEKVLSINFDKYRLIDGVIKIDLVDGFEMELLSFNMLKQEGISFDKSIYDRKMTSYNPDVKSVDAVRLDLELGKKDVSSEEIWVID